MNNTISKYKIQKELDIIMHKLFVIKKQFELRKNLTSGENLEYLCKKFPYTFSTIINSLDNNYMLELIKLLKDDNRNHNTVCFSDILRLYNNNPNCFKEKKYYYIPCNTDNQKMKRINLHPQNTHFLFTRLENDINNNMKIIDYLHCRRNKSLAHNDKKFSFEPTKYKFTNNSIKYQEIDDLINLLIKDMTNIYHSLYGTAYCFHFGETEEINYLKEIIKKDYHSRKTINKKDSNEVNPK